MLVTGWGRVAKILALRLYALGALVTVAARKDGDRAMARALGLDSCDFDGIYEQAEEFDFVANTVPARVLEDGVYAPYTAAELMRETIYTVISEGDE